MLTKLPTACYALKPEPRDDDYCYLDLQTATDTLRDLDDDADPDDAHHQGRLATVSIIQNSAPCSHLACNGCGEAYIDDEYGVVHIQTNLDEKLAADDAIEAGWVRGFGTELRCPSCAPTELAPAPVQQVHGQIPLFEVVNHADGAA